MALAYITEYSRLALNDVGGAIQAGQEPAIARHIVDFTTAVQSNVFNKETKLIRITSDAEAFLLFGDNPTATASGANVGTQIQADTPEFFGVQGGHRVSVYDGVSV